MQFSLAQSLGKTCPTIDVIDVGAMALDAEPEYAPILAKAPCRVVGFEPVQAECDKLNAAGHANRVFLPYFIGDGTERTFHLTNFSATASLYEPDTEFLSLFNTLAEVTTVTQTSRVQTRRLDDIPEIANIDLLKIDIQGAELDAFRGGSRLLDTTLAVWTEVEFAPMYKNQPLFGDVDAELRRHQLMLHTVHSLEGRSYTPLVPPRGPTAGIRQHLWSDVIYLRDPRRIGDLDHGKMLKLAVIAHDLLGSFDYAQLVLQYADRHSGGSLWKWYMTRLTGEDPGEPTLPRR